MDKVEIFFLQMLSNSPMLFIESLQSGKLLLTQTTLQNNGYSLLPFTPDEREAFFTLEGFAGLAKMIKVDNNVNSTFPKVVERMTLEYPNHLERLIVFFENQN